MKEILHIYTRVSTSIQEEGTSLKTQKETGIELAKKLNMDYLIHNEGGSSSAKDNLDNRPVLMNILRQMDTGGIKHLYVWNTDRLSRNQITWYTIRQKMVKHKVILYTANGVHNQNDFMENMILGILSEVSQYDNSVRAERSRLGKIEKVKLNYWRGGDCPFGFMLKSDGRGNKLAENTEESKWIRFIFQEYSKGTPLKDIKSVLEKNKIKTRRDNKFWSLGSLQAIIKNPIYLGFDQYIDKKTKLEIKNTIPQLIPNKLWGEVQERRKLKLLRKGQLNRTTKFYLFRDFLICSCGTPMGGRIKTDKFVAHYYCPLSERKFNNSYKGNITCEMKRSLNIPTTDTILWNKIIDILGNTTILKDSLKKQIGRKFSPKELKNYIEEQEKRINELTQVKNDIEKGLVNIEAENILNKYQSIEIFHSLKKELSKRYQQTLSEIEDIRTSLTEIGNEEKWFDWVDAFSQQMEDSREVSDSMKKELLRLIVKEILVTYDDKEKVHILTINFRLPVIMANDERINPALVVVKPPKAGRKSHDQNSAVGDYSTVMKSSPIPPDDNSLQSYSLLFSLQITSANLWESSYSPYQQELFDHISRFHDEGWNFKQISDWLVENNYKTPRGHAFMQKHVWSIYQKKNRSIKRFSREFEDIITEMKIDVVDFAATTK
jgi:site-specific DNA recombinase